MEFNKLGERNLVSIIIPVYNVEKYLRICLDSVLAQTYGDYEVIMVDDGSTDNSAKICEEYEKKDERFHLIRQENKGPATARNLGIRESKGEYVYFIDSDDCINSVLLETVVRIAEENNADIVQINLKSVPADFIAYNERIDTTPVPLQSFSVTQAIRNLDEDNKRYAENIRLTTAVLWTKLYQRHIFDNLLFPDGMYMHEDQLMAHQFIAKAGGMIFLDCPLYYYRKSDVSLIRTGWSPIRLSIMDCYEDRLRCVMRLADGEKNADSKNLVDFIYWRYLVCLFRNYDMICQKMSGADRDAKKKEVIKKVKSLLREKPGKLPVSKRIFMNCFCVMPGVFQTLFFVRNNIRSRN